MNAQFGILGSCRCIQLIFHLACITSSRVQIFSSNEELHNQGLPLTHDQ